MRLNFSGSSEDEIREGVRRIGAIVREQVELYGMLTGTTAPRAPEAPAPRTDLADVLALPRRPREDDRRRGRG
jgi:2-aminoadipate transaminase